jgi:cytochrome P450
MEDILIAPLPPGPKRNVLFTSRKALENDVLGLLQRNVQNWPGISRMKIGPYYFVNVSDPACIEKVFTDTENFGKGRENFKMRFLLGRGLLTNEGKFWLKQRRLIQPLFHKQRLEGFVQSISRCTSDMLREWDERKVSEVDVHAEMTRVTLGIVSRTLMSTDASGEFRHINAALTVLMYGLTRRNRNFITFPYWVPTPRNLRMKSNRKMLWGTIYGIIAERRADNRQYDDLLSMLMEVEDADTAERMSDEQIKDEVITIFLAGHETTANAMSFALYLLAKHPEARQRIAAEYKAATEDGELSYQALSKLDYTTRVIKEAMRLYPPA